MHLTLRIFVFQTQFRINRYLTYIPGEGKSGNGGLTNNTLAGLGSATSTATDPGSNAHMVPPVKGVDITIPQKRMRTHSDPLGVDLEDSSARHVHIECMCTDNPDAFKSINSFKISDEIEDIIGWYPDGKTLSSGVLLIECDSFAQVRILLT